MNACAFALALNPAPSTAKLSFALTVRGREGHAPQTYLRAPLDRLHRQRVSLVAVKPLEKHWRFFFSFTFSSGCWICAFV